MKSTERPAFPVETFLAAGIPREGTVELRVNGIVYSYGKISTSDQCGNRPPIDELMEIAYEDECREVLSAEVDCEGCEMTEGRSLAFTFETGFAKDFLQKESHRHPIAVRSTGFSRFDCGRVMRPPALRVDELVFMTHSCGDLWLDGKPLVWRDEDFEHARDYFVIADGVQFTHAEYWCNYGGRKAEVLEALMDLQLPWGDIQREEAGTVLRDMPERWANVARDFIQRHGRAAAEAIIGVGHLAPLLQGVLWERLTSVAVEDKRQLHLWPTESTHA